MTMCCGTCSSGFGCLCSVSRALKNSKLPPLSTPQCPEGVDNICLQRNQSCSCGFQDGCTSVAPSWGSERASMVWPFSVRLKSMGPEKKRKQDSPVTVPEPRFCMQRPLPAHFWEKQSFLQTVGFKWDLKPFVLFFLF